MKLNLIAGLLALCLSGPSSALPITIEEGDFSGPAWGVERVLKLGPDTATSFAANQVLAGGNPNAFLSVSHSFNSAPNGIVSGIGLVHANASNTYDPGIIGPIGSIDARLDFLNIDTFGDGQAVALAIIQGADIFMSGIGVTGTIAGWQTLAVNGLRSSDFGLLGSTELIVDFGISPNLDNPFALGFLTANSNGGFGGSGTRIVGYDNFMVSLNPRAVPEPTSLALVWATVLGGTLTRRRFSSVGKGRT